MGFTSGIKAGSTFEKQSMWFTILTGCNKNQVVISIDTKRVFGKNKYFEKLSAT